MSANKEPTVWEILFFDLFVMALVVAAISLWTLPQMLLRWWAGSVFPW